MDITKNFNSFDFIKLDELNVFSDTKIVIMFARFMHNSGANWTTDTHSHSYYELHFPLIGKCSLILQDSQPITLHKGEHLLINPNTNHKFIDFSDDFLRLSVAFDIQFNNNALVENDKYILGNSSSNIQTLLDNMFEEYNERDIGYKSIVKFNIQTALIEFFRIYPSILTGEKKVSESNQKVFNKSLTFIRNNISMNITPELVAQNVELSTRQLNRIFMANLNMSVSNFIKNEKILQVREHLKKTNLSLHEIASLTGFNDEYVLCKVFKKINGISPGKYRANYKKKG